MDLLKKMKNIYLSKGQNLIETFSYNNWNMLDNHTVSNANADVYDMSYNYSRGWHLIEKADGIRNTSDNIVVQENWTETLHGSQFCQSSFFGTKSIASSMK